MDDREKAPGESAGEVEGEDSPLPVPTATGPERRAARLPDGITAEEFLAGGWSSSRRARPGFSVDDFYRPGA